VTVSVVVFNSVHWVTGVQVADAGVDRLAQGEIVPGKVAEAAGQMVAPVVAFTGKEPDDGVGMNVVDVIGTKLSYRVIVPEGVPLPAATCVLTETVYETFCIPAKSVPFVMEPDDDVLAESTK